jgi:hypothetical protein
MTKNEMIEIMFNNKDFKNFFNFYVEHSTLSIEKIYDIYLNYLYKIRETKIDNILKSFYT